jgi:hypothetical protein
MSKIKNSKYKNTAILFELLIRQITNDTIAGNDSQAVNIIKKYFSKTELAKEHKLYQSLINNKNLFLTIGLNVCVRLASIPSRAILIASLTTS